MAGETFLGDVIRQDGTISADRLTEQLHVSRQELATASGLSRESVSKTVRLLSPTTQSRLRDVVEIVNRVLPWAGSVPQAFAWYRAEPLPSFGHLTAEDLVKQGRAEDVKRFLSRIALGGYA